MHSKPSIYNVILLILIVFENLFFFILYKEGYLDSATNAICYSITSLLIGVLLLLKYYNKNIEPDKTVTFLASKNNLFVFLLTVIAVIWLCIKTYPIFKEFPVKANMSDIFPTIEVLTKRFFVPHQSPYDRDALIYLGYTIPSTYLPMHWLPYCIAEAFKFDYRWITFSIWVIGFFIIVYNSAKQKNYINSILNITLMSCLYFLITDKYPNIISYTVETMVAGYYMIFIASINQKNGYLLGISIGICLLSRYSLVLWLPLMAFVLFVSENKKILYKTVFTSVLFVCALYVIPYLSHDWTAFYDAHMAYEKNVVGEWYHNNELHLPYHLFKGVGAAQFFYNAYINTDLHIGYKLLRATLFISIFVSTLFLLIWYWFKRTKIDYRIFLLASFKIYITIFFAFIMVPYLYLIVIGNFISIAIFAEQLKYKPVSTNAA